MYSLSEIFKKVKQNKEFLTLIIIIFLACLLCFSLGWLIGKSQAKQPLEFLTPKGDCPPKTVAENPH